MPELVAFGPRVIFEKLGEAAIGTGPLRFGPA